jgi:hypothetical protein|tara:strand:- start:20 stop:208 length:189 start_codon:yes stop_codon:yes gene_type:complete
MAVEHSAVGGRYRFQDAAICVDHALKVHHLAETSRAFPSEDLANLGGSQFGAGRFQRGRRDA